MRIAFDQEFNFSSLQFPAIALLTDQISDMHSVGQDKRKLTRRKSVLDTG